MADLERFIANLHPSTEVLGNGEAMVMDHVVKAVVVRNLYGQIIVWGPFSVDKGKFKGKIANNAGTEGVKFRLTQVISTFKRSPTERAVSNIWLEHLKSSTDSKI